MHIFPIYNIVSMVMGDGVFNLSLFLLGAVSKYKQLKCNVSLSFSILVKTNAERVFGHTYILSAILTK